MKHISKLSKHDGNFSRMQHFMEWLLEESHERNPAVTRKNKQHIMAIYEKYSDENLVV